MASIIIIIIILVLCRIQNNRLLLVVLFFLDLKMISKMRCSCVCVCVCRRRRLYTTMNNDNQQNQPEIFFFIWTRQISKWQSKKNIKMKPRPDLTRFWKKIYSESMDREYHHYPYITHTHTHTSRDGYIFFRQISVQRTCVLIFFVWKMKIISSSGCCYAEILSFLFNTSTVFFFWLERINFQQQSFIPLSLLSWTTKKKYHNSIIWMNHYNLDKNKNNNCYYYLFFWKSYITHQQKSLSKKNFKNLNLKFFAVQFLFQKKKELFFRTTSEYWLIDWWRKAMNLFSLQKKLSFLPNIFFCFDFVQKNAIGVSKYGKYFSQKKQKQKQIINP